MVIDTSALIELVLKGPLRDRVRAALSGSTAQRAISAVSWVEAHIVLRRKYAPAHYQQAAGDLGALQRGYSIQIYPATVSQSLIAIDAFRRFGKGAGGGALNFGDCFVYALAKRRDDELLFVGNDFSKTDIKVAAY